MSDRTISISPLQMISIFLIILLLLSLLEQSGIGKIGPSVSNWEAQRVAKKHYDLVEINQTYIKHINDIDYVNEDFVLPSQNPVYRVIEGISREGKKMAVFVESNNPDVHFSIKLVE
jgi:uncharacterized protein YpmB